MDSSVYSSSISPRQRWTTDDIRRKVDENKVVVFAKGDRMAPRDGFSERAFSAIDDTGKPYDIVDVSSDSSIMAALRSYAGRVTIPMIYVDGELVSSSETLQRMLNTGEFQAKVNGAFD